MKRIAFASLLCLLVGLAIAQDGITYEVTITNLTKSQIISPPVVISHGPGYELFALGSPASAALALLAEDGSPADVIAEAEAHEAVFDTQAATGPLMPGHSVTLHLQLEFGYTHISAAGMLVTTNDAFFGLAGVRIPPPSSNFLKNGHGTAATLYAQAYDAGSEANTEDCASIPGPPCGNGGVRVTDGAEGFIHIHSGIHGIGSISPASYDWRGPVAKVSIRRMN